MHSTPSSAQQEAFNKRMHLGFPATVFTSIIATDSCYYVTGIVADTVFPYETGALFVKFSLEGEPITVKTITDTINSFETWYGNLEWTGANEMAVSGYGHDSTMNALLIKYNTEGDTIATYKFKSMEWPGDPFIIAYDWERASTIDSSFYLFNWIGDAFNESNAELSVIRASKDGALVWQKKYPNYLWDRANCSTMSNGQLILGALRQNINITDYNYQSQDNIFAIDSAGNIEWQYLSPAGELRRGATALAPAGDGGLVVASGRGEEFNINPSRNGLRWHSGLIYKLDAQQQLEWEVEFIEPLPNSFYNRFNKIIRASDGSGYLAAGLFVQGIPESLEADLSGWLVKVSPDGDSLWSRALRFFEPQDPYYWHHLYDIKETADGGFIMVGQAEDINGGWQGQQGWLIKVDEHGCLVPGCHLTPVSEAAAAGPRLLLYPNPADDFLNVFLKDSALSRRAGALFRIFDAQGRLLAAYSAGQLEEATHLIPVHALPSGPYLLQYLDRESLLWSGRFVKR